MEVILLNDVKGVGKKVKLKQLMMVMLQIF